MKNTAEARNETTNPLDDIKNETTYEEHPRDHVLLKPRDPDLEPGKTYNCPTNHTEEHNTAVHYNMRPPNLNKTANNGPTPLDERHTELPK